MVDKNIFTNIDFRHSLIIPIPESLYQTPAKTTIKKLKKKVNTRNYNHRIKVFSSQHRERIGIHI